MGTLRTIAEIGYGLLFLAGAGFNAVYTSTHADDFYGSFADGAFLPWSRRLIENVVIPNATVFTLAIVVFEAAVAVMILLRGDLVQPALFAGAGFALAAAYSSSPGGALGNMALATGLVLLGAAR